MSILSAPKNKRLEMIETARSHIGYRAAPLKANDYGPHGFDWDGAFVSHILKTSGYGSFSFTSTTAALQWAVRDRLIFQAPQVGDIAVFAFSQGEGQPHVGIVSDARSWKINRSFSSIEAQVPSPAPRENQDPTGVFEWLRYGPDVIGFIRLPPATEDRGTNKDAPLLRVSECRLGARGVQIERLQSALGEASCLSQASRGVYDRTTASALRAWERKCGSVGNTQRALDLLAKRTGYFRTGL